MAVKTLNIVQPARGLSKVMGIPKSSRPCNSPSCSGMMVGALLGLPSGVKLRFYCETCKTAFLPGSGTAKLDPRIAKIVSDLEVEDKAIEEMADKLRKPSQSPEEPKMGDQCLCDHVRRGHYVVLSSVSKDGCSQCSCGGFRLAEPEPTVREEPAPECKHGLGVVTSWGDDGQVRCECGKIWESREDYLSEMEISEAEVNAAEASIREVATGEN